MENKKRYFYDLLMLSPSFSPEEKKAIFESYTSSDIKLQNGIDIFEEELKKIVEVYIKHEAKKIELGAQYLKNISTPGINTDKTKILKIQNTLSRNKQLEKMEKEDENLEEILFSI